MKPSPFKRIPVWIVGAVLTLVCLLRGLQVDFLERLECMTFDWRARQALQFPGPVATNLGFVFITEESVKRVRDGSLGYSFGLYWPRQVYGRLVQELADQGAQAVALDVIFGGLRRDHPPVQMADGQLVESDSFFAQQLQRASNTIIAVTREVSPPAWFLTNALAPGDISTDRDPDGIVRRAKAFRLYRRWHPLFLQAEADPDLGIDLSLARLEPNQIVLPRPDGEQIRVPLDAQGNFALADFVGDKLAPGLGPKAKPFTEERVWHMGIVLAAQQLKLDLTQAEVDLPHGRITLRGPAGVQRTIPVDARGYFYIDWCLPLNHPRLAQQPIHDLLRQHRLRLEGQTNHLSERWRGKLAVVGSAAVLGNDLTDRGATPLEADTLLVSKHWNVASDLITGRFVQRSGLGVDWAILLGLGLLAAVLTWQLRPMLAFGVVLGLAAVYIALGVSIYLHTRYWIPLVLPLGGALLLTHLCLLTWRVVFEQAEQRRVKAIFSTLVSPKIVQELLQAETLSLGGARRQITVMFADVRDFTEFTDASQEQVAQQVRQQRLSNAAAEAAFDEQARQTLATVNLYLGPVADTILQHDGTLNKFIGDCIMAFWGAPTPNPRHALSCVRAAIEAQRAIDALNQQRAAENQRRTAENQARLAAGRPPLPLLPILRLGTGINTGMATVGLMGSDHAVVRQGDYTAFGREVNLASRLEGASGHGRILISEATYEHLRRDDPVLAASCLALAPMAVKGFRTPVQVFEVPWLVGTPKPEIRRELATRHSRCRRAGWWLRALWLGGWLCVAPLWAAPPQTAFDVWQVADSWQQNTVSTIAQSHQGYLWLGTYHGLVRFDGVRFTVFDSSNTRGLCNGLITSLYEDPQGVLWIGHETGQLSRLSRGEFQPVPLGPTWPGGTVETITSDESGDLWLLNTSGVLFRVRDGHAVLCPGGASPGRKAALTRASDGKLWIVSNGQVAALDHGKVVPYSFPEATASDYYERVLPARDGGLWVLGNQRLRKWSEDRWSDELEACPRGAGTVTALWETRSGALLVGTLKEGLYVLTPGAASQHFSRANGLSQDWVRTLWEDHEGNIWIGTGAGLDGLRPRKVQMLNAPDGWQGCAVLSFSLRQDGSAWIGTEGAGLYRYQHQQWTTFGESSGLTNSFVWSVFETRQRQLLVGTWGGGLLVEQGEHFAATNPFAQLSAPVVAIFQSRNGDLWMGTTSGLFRYRGGKLLWSATKDQLAMPDVRAITQTPDGTLYFGMSGGGLGAFKRGVLRQFRKEDGLGSDFVVTLHADADDTLWIGTSDHGLTRLKQGKFTTLSLEQGLPSNVILQLLEDDAGNLWMGSSQGISRASKADLHRCADGLASSVQVLSYSKADGLASPLCSGGFQPGACKATDGRLWFPTAKGLAIIDPVNVTTNPVPPPVVIEELLVDGQPQPTAALTAGPHASCRIPAGKQRFELRYTGLSFAAPDKVRFKYKLEGLEDEWVDGGTKRVALYSYLPPGTYTFHVMACNNDEVWSQSDAAFAFTVLPHFWQTWWCRAASTGTGALGIGTAVLWVTRRRVRRKLELLERQRALERERARIARDIHDDLGASLTRITLLSQSVQTELEDRPQAAKDLDQIYRTARELTRAMDEIVWAVNPKHDTLDSLVTYLGRFAQNFLSAAAIRCRLDVPVQLPPWALTSEVRHNVFLAFKEALHNIVKHAQATEVRLSLDLLPAGFVLVVADNGCGFDWQAFKTFAPAPSDPARQAAGNGLLNMQKRLEEIGGHCDWSTAPGEGTRVKFSVAVIKRHDN